ncbi:hypothetical protein ACFQ5M_04230 [Agrilactobacillus yilanensis]|uniref:ABC transporter permease n=1 Tax=Agrilactobacillus yilanensis TaxID=2485997 RepID=A0ABW4J514_9LACO|nr:hypothetical protein [Agrilactobacillus yilanensis]
MKFKTAFIYQVKRQLLSLGIFLVFWFVFTFGISFILMIVSKGDVHTTNDFTFATIAYIILLSCMMMKKDFRFFIQNGLSRGHIFLVNVLSTTLSALLLGLMTQFTLHQFTFGNGDTFRFTNIFVTIYKPSQWLISLGLIWMLLLWINSVAILVGGFLNRIRGWLRILLIIIFIISPTILVGFVGATMPTNHQITIFVAQCVGLPNGLPNIGGLSVTLSILILINLGLTYLFNRRQPIVRIDG